MLHSQNQINQAFLAVAKGDMVTLERLSKLDIDFTQIKDMNGDSLVHIAAVFGNSAALCMLAQLGCSANVSSPDGITPIFLAVEYAQPQVLPILEKMRADVALRNPAGHTPIHEAAIKNSLVMLTALKKYNGANLNEQTSKEKLTAAHYAAISGSITMLQQIKRLGGEIDIPDRHGETPLYYAVRRGDIPTIRELTRLGANLNKHNKAGILPILIALFDNDTDTFTCLLELINSVHITFFYDRFNLLTIVRDTFEKLPRKLIDLINSKPSFSSYTLEEFAVALDNQVIFDLLTQNKFTEDMSQTCFQKYRPTAGFRLFDPDIATRLLTKENRWGNIEARHASAAAQEEFDKAYGLVVSKPHLF